MIWHLNKNDSLILLVSYGDQEISSRKSDPGLVWQNGSKAASLALRANT